PRPQISRFFSAFPGWCEEQVARPAASITAVIFVALWLAADAFVAWSNAWQLIVNTTFRRHTVMIFVISHAQRRDTQAIQLKLDELIRVNSEARNELISLEAKPEPRSRRSDGRLRSCTKGWRRICLNRPSIASGSSAR